MATRSLYKKWYKRQRHHCVHVHANLRLKTMTPKMKQHLQDLGVIVIEVKDTEKPAKVVKDKDVFVDPRDPISGEVPF